MLKVIDYKPKNAGIVQAKPKVDTNNNYTDRLYDVTLGRGMLVGFGPHITYPESIDILSPKSS